MKNRENMKRKNPESEKSEEKDCQIIRNRYGSDETRGAHQLITCLSTHHLFGPPHGLRNRTRRLSDEMRRLSDEMRKLSDEMRRLSDEMRGAHQLITSSPPVLPRLLQQPSSAPVWLTTRPTQQEGKAKGAPIHPGSTEPRD